MLDNPEFYEQLRLQIRGEWRAARRPKRIHHTELLDSLIEKRKNKIKNENQNQRIKEFEKKKKFGLKTGNRPVGIKKSAKYLEESKTRKPNGGVEKIEIEMGEGKDEATDAKKASAKKPEEESRKKQANNVYATMFDEVSSSSGNDLFGSDQDNEASEGSSDSEDSDLETEPLAKKRKASDQENKINCQRGLPGLEEANSEALEKKSEAKEGGFCERINQTANQLAGELRQGSDKVRKLRAKLEQIEKKKKVLFKEKKNYFAFEKDYVRTFQKELLKGNEKTVVGLEKRRTWLEDLNPDGLNVFNYKYLDQSRDKNGPERIFAEEKTKGENGNMLNSLEKKMGLYRKEVDVGLNLSLNERVVKKANLSKLGLDFKNNNVRKACLNGHWDYREELLSRTLPYVDLNDPYLRSLVENFNRQKLLGQGPDEGSKPTIYDITKNRSDAMQVKKQYRMILAKINRGSSLANIDDLKKLKDDIVFDRDCEIGNLLGINKIEDFKENEEIIKNRKRRVKAIHHTPVADKFLHYDFVIKPERVVNLYR